MWGSSDKHVQNTFQCLQHCSCHTGFLVGPEPSIGGGRNSGDQTVFAVSDFEWCKETENSSIFTAAQHMLLSSVPQLWGEPGHFGAYGIALPCCPALFQDLFIDTEKKTVCAYILWFIYNMWELQLSVFSFSDH